MGAKTSRLGVVGILVFCLAVQTIVVYEVYQHCAAPTPPATNAGRVSKLRATEGGGIHAYVTGPTRGAGRAAAATSVASRLRLHPAIPRTLHHIWIGPSPSKHPKLFPHIERLATAAKEMHEADGWEYHRWGNELYTRYKDDRYVRYYLDIIADSPVAEKWTAILVDRLRLLILRDDGGVFTDIDVEFKHSMERVVGDEIPPESTFFAGLRRMQQDNIMLEVAVIGAAPGARPVTTALAEYAKFNPPLQFSLDAIFLPMGGTIGRWLALGLDGHSHLLNYNFFYTSDEAATNETVLVNKVMQTWTFSKEEAFGPVYSEDETRHSILEMIGIVNDLVPRVLGIPDGGAFWIGGELLVGLARNGTLHPWNDAFDIFVGRNYAAGAKSKLEGPLGQKGLLMKEFWAGIKIFRPTAPLIQGFEWAWPCVELKWYDGGQLVHLPSGGQVAGKPVKLSDNDILPTTIARLDDGHGKMTAVRVPHDYDRVLQHMISPDWRVTCKSRWWDRQKEQSRRSKQVQCEELGDMYAWNEMDELVIAARGKPPPEDSAALSSHPYRPPLDLSQLKTFRTRLEDTDNMRKDLIALLGSLTEATSAEFGAQLPVWMAGPALQHALEFDGWAVPAWSDQIDVYLDRAAAGAFEENGAITARLKLVSPRAVHVSPFWGGFKIYFKDSKPAKKGVAWGFPSLEIRYYTTSEDGKHFVVPTGKGTATISTVAVLPVKIMDVVGPAGMRGRAPVPVDADATNSAIMGKELVRDGICHGREWDRQHESAVPEGTLGVNAPCKLVKQFVE